MFLNTEKPLVLNSLYIPRYLYLNLHLYLYLYLSLYLHLYLHHYLYLHTNTSTNKTLCYIQVSASTLGIRVLYCTW